MPAQLYLTPDLTSTVHGDGREQELLNFIYTHPDLATMRGNPAGVLAAIDEFGATKDFLMTIGEEKRGIIIEHLTKCGAKVMLELGAYVGYSAIALAAALRDLHPGAAPGEVRYITFELSPVNAAVTSLLVDLAGLKSVVDVVVGPAGESIRRVAAEGKVRAADAILIDHWSDVYVPDLQACEEAGLLRPGTVIFADNILVPGAPAYREYVNAGKAVKAPPLQYKTVGIKSQLPSGHTDELEVTTVV